MSTNQSKGIKHKVIDTITKLLKIEVPKNIFEHKLEELELTLFQRDKRHVFLPHVKSNQP